MNQTLRIHILSDLHLDCATFAPTVQDADVVVLAGDIHVKGRGLEWARSAFSCPVLYVPGNHEYYQGHLTRTLEKMRKAADERVRVLDFDRVTLGGVRFLGVTGWTDYSATGNAPLAQWDARRTMNDFKKIRADSTFRKPFPEDFAALSARGKRWLRERLAEPFAGPTVVITHHAPSMLSLGRNSEPGSHLDAAYANRWEYLMGAGVTLWIHGHTHCAVDYGIDGTRVISNPRGYPGEITGFDPNLVVELACASEGGDGAAG